MKAIVLAAGEGKRVSFAGNGKPKCLLEVGRTTLLNVNLDTLYRCGIEDIVLIRGYEKAQIDIPALRYYDNDDFAVTGALYSLLAAEQELEGDVIVLFSDIYYDEHIINALLKSQHDITIAGMVGHAYFERLECSGARDEIELIEFNADNSVERIGKHPAQDCGGTKALFTGIFKLNDSGVRKLRNFLRLYSHKADASGEPCYRRASVADLFSDMIGIGIEIHAAVVESGWFEVNTVEDYQTLLKLPEIKDKYLITDTDWGKRSETYDELEWVSNDELLKQLGGRLDALNEDSCVLDVGTGTGKVLIHLKMKKGNAHYHGIDTSDAMIRKIDPSHGFHLRQASVTDLDLYPDNLFDYVTARMILHHVDDVDKAMREIYKKLKRGGKLISCEGNPPSYASYDFYTEMFFYKEIRNVFMEADLINLYIRNGFRNVTTRTIILKNMSLNNWIENSGLPRRNIDIIKRMHYECSEVVKRDYNMAVRDNDIMMDWKFSLVEGEK